MILLLTNLVSGALLFQGLAFRPSRTTWRKRNQLLSSSDNEPNLFGNRLLIDPLLTDFLYDHDENDDGSRSRLWNLGSLADATNGIQIWRDSITKGRLPTVDEFPGKEPWPENPLFSALVNTMIELQLPRFALRHIETVPIILRSLVRLTTQFNAEILINENESDEIQANDCVEQEDIDDLSITSSDEEFDSFEVMFVKDTDMIAQELAEELQEEWSSVVNGVSILDQLFGFDHNLLQTNNENVNMDRGFGFEDGIWTHTGWHIIPELQAKISSMPELKKLVREMGRRPTVEDSDRVHKFSPRKFTKDGVLGAEFDPINRESVTGITMSSNLAEMLPSEAVLLRSSSPALRRLFLQKKVEAKLLSYQLSGWTDVPSIALTRPLYKKRMPSAPGGPIIVCLDTSWSMSNSRETLSKAVVLACVCAAHSQKRDCQVVAFSSKQNIIETGVINADNNGMGRLLEFLSSSFGGGTDVTGALKFAMTTIDSEVMSAADILLISDGEIQDPPVPNDIMEALDVLKLRKGVEVHGLLVGKQESKPLSRLCTQVHDFLVGYENPLLLSQTGGMSSRFQRSSTAMGSTKFPTIRSRTLGIRQPERPSRLTLHAKYSELDDEWGGQKTRKKNRGKQSEDNDYYETSTTEQNESKGSLTDPFLSQVDTAVDSLKQCAIETMESNSWSPKVLEEENNAAGSFWRFRNDIKGAVDRIDEGLVERTEEARLVVLAMLATEHILLLGVPGTAKSILGRRLSRLCDGSFFQRLLTRFTTPEELFGPLSLRSLENDEYRRVTLGYLPTASVAFLDEIFKSNSAILNTLLTILNERKFDNGGVQEECPIRCVVGASNELPESDELVALFDRFLIRKEVESVSDEGLGLLLSMPNPGHSHCDDSNAATKECDVLFTEGLDNVIDALSSAASAVSIGREACEVIKNLRTFMREEHSVEVSDRRLVKATRLIKISAATHGRNQVDPIDCMLLQHCVWEQPEQRADVREWLWDNMSPGSGESGRVGHFRFLLEGLRQDIIATLRKTSGDINGEFGGKRSDIGLLKNLEEETTRLDAILQQRLNDLYRHKELLSQSRDFLWIGPDESQAMQQLLLPRVDSMIVETKETLLNAITLRLSIQDGSVKVSNECRLSAIEKLWDGDDTAEVSFSEDELAIGMKEAKAKFDLETFRKWKRAKKKATK